MAYQEFIEELNTTPQAAAPEYQSAAVSLMSALGQRFPGMERVMQLSLNGSGEHLSRVQDAMRLLSTNDPVALQQAVAVMSGRSA